MEHPELDLAYRLLDLDLIDSEDRRCGKVDDLELSGGPGQPTYVAAIIAGPGALPARFPRRLRRHAARTSPVAEPASRGRSSTTSIRPSS